MQNFPPWAGKIACFSDFPVPSCVNVTCVLHHARAFSILMEREGEDRVIARGDAAGGKSGLLGQGAG